MENDFVSKIQSYEKTILELQEQLVNIKVGRTKNTEGLISTQTQTEHENSKQKMPNTKVTDVDSCAEMDEYKKATLPIPPKVQGKIKKREKEIKSDNTKRKRKFTTKIDKKSNPHKKEMQMILRNNIQKQRHQIEETALQVNGDATDEQESLSIVSLRVILKSTPSVSQLGKDT
ncbi:hypothetical protein JTB14_036103 [Gonioctena quinquepunctata]|nr:hypothetical protein JTB14_036103 [Gonioctena quinquepunctata]